MIVQNRLLRGMGGKLFFLALLWLVACGPGGSSVSMRSAIDALYAGRYAKSESHFQRARLDAREALEKNRATFGLAEALAGQRRYEEALPLYREVAESREAPARLRLNAREGVGRSLYHLGSLQKAQETLFGVFRQLQRLSETEKLDFRTQNRLLLSLGRLEARATYDLGLIDYKLGKLASAAVYLEKVVHLLPGGPVQARAWTILAEARLAEGRFEAALETLGRAYVAAGEERREQRCQILQLQADIYLQRKNNSAAIEALVYSQRNCRDLTKTRTKLHEIISSLPAGELRTLVKAYPNEPPGDMAAFYLGRALAEEGNLKGGMDVLRQILLDHPDSPYLPKVQGEIEAIEQRLVVDPHSIGFIGPLSGRFAAVGKEILAGARLAVDLYNENHPATEFRLLVIDSEGKPEKACEAIQELASEKRVIGIVGPVTTASLKACLPVIAQLEIPVITPSATGEGLVAKSDYAFRTCLLQSQQIRRVLEFASKSLGARRFALIYPQNSYGLAMREIFHSAVRAQSSMVVAEGSYAPSTPDFKGPILKIKPAEPEAIFLLGGAKTIGLMAPQLAFYELGAAILLGTNALNAPQVIQIGGKHVEGLMFVDDFYLSSPSPLVQGFSQQYTQVYGRRPTRLAAQAYDTARLVMLKVLELGNRVNRTALMRAIQSTANFDSVTGLRSFDMDGESVKDLHLLGIRNGRIIQVLPP